MSAVLESIAAEPPRCPVCEGEAESFREAHHPNLYACLRCALGFVHPRPMPGDHRTFDPLEFRPTRCDSYNVPLRAPGMFSRLRKHIAWRVDQGLSLCNVIEETLPERGAILGIAGADGALRKELAARGHRVTGVAGDVRSTSLELGSCDGVVFSHVVEHLADPVKALSDAAALLKPSGLLFCEVPNNESVIARQSGRTWEHLGLPRHINFFTERSLVALVRSAGLVLRRVYFSGYGRCFDDSQAATWRLLARTVLAYPRFKYDSVGIVAGWPPALM